MFSGSALRRLCRPLFCALSSSALELTLEAGKESRQIASAVGVFMHAGSIHVVVGHLGYPPGQSPPGQVPPGQSPPGTIPPTAGSVAASKDETECVLNIISKLKL